MRRLYQFLLISLLLGSCFRIYAQTMQTKIENITSLGREKVIEMAYSLIEVKHPNLELLPEDYEISVWANSEDITVEFRRLMKYFPKEYNSRDKKYYSLIYDVSVNLLTQHIKPFDDSFSFGRFHIPSAEEQQIIDFVKKHTGLPISQNDSNDYDIHDKENYYDFYIRLNGSFTNYKIDKITGEQYDWNELHTTPAVLPESILDSEDKLVRIF